MLSRCPRRGRWPELALHTPDVHGAGSANWLFSADSDASVHRPLVPVPPGTAPLLLFFSSGLLCPEQPPRHPSSQAPYIFSALFPSTCVLESPFVQFHERPRWFLGKLRGVRASPLRGLLGGPASSPQARAPGEVSPQTPRGVSSVDSVCPPMFIMRNFKHTEELKG